MPIAYDTQGTFDLVLPCDRGLPPDKQVVFHIKKQSRREKQALLDIVNPGIEAGQKGDIGRLYEAMDEVCTQLIVGWSNFKDKEGNDVPCTPENIQRLPDMLTDDDYTDLFTGALNANTPGKPEQKK